MTIRDIKDKLGCRQAAGTDKMLEREITGVYCCDLLVSMAKLDRREPVITVHTNSMWLLSRLLPMPPV